ncbi:DAAT [Symbiodinium natans]|uniref:DAAT protein n=1 Tax=Symbiodinium natans TaxID=878477 RepID=A0A812HP44_9DINO|nr:DAAT [Symbiodinium natans]
MKPTLLATLKSNNYLLNCLLAMSAQERGGCFGINIREDGTVAEGCVANCAIVTADKVFITPPFEGILAGTTVRKAMDLAKKHLVGEGKVLREIRQETMHKEQLFSAQEVIMCSGDLGINPAITLDGQRVGNGEVGPVARELKRLIWEDAYDGAEEHIQLSYE